MQNNPNSDLCWVRLILQHRPKHGGLAQPSRGWRDVIFYTINKVRLLARLKWSWAPYSELNVHDVSLLDSSTLGRVPKTCHPPHPSPKPACRYLDVFWNVFEDIRVCIPRPMGTCVTFTKGQLSQISFPEKMFSETSGQVRRNRC